MESAALRAAQPKATKRTLSRKVLEPFIYEVINGQPLYYYGYREAIAQNLSPESVMGTGRKQSYLIDLILHFMNTVLNRKLHRTSINEPGVLFANKDHVSNDIIIYNAADKDKMFVDKYFDFPPKIVVEVDTKIEWRDLDWAPDYYQIKTQKLLDFGVEKVVWIYTKIRKIQVAERGKPWLTVDWDDTVEVLPGCSLNLKRLLEEDGTDMETAFPIDH